jgi:hypothetical protein
MPIIALEENNNDKAKPSDNKPLRGLLIKSSRNLINAELSFCPGITSRIRSYNSFSTRFGMGRNGISVKRKMIAGGIAITKLNAMDEARSLIPTVFTWPKKNWITSYNGMPRNPGNEMDLLFRTRYSYVGEVVILFFIRE